MDNTPNPCVICNPSIKLAFLLESANKIGAENIATGHYARIKFPSGKNCLYKGMDPKKDQSYVLCRLNQKQLSKLILPLGDLTKSQVKEIGTNCGLSFVNQPESQDLCFLSRLNYRQFVNDYTPAIAKPGEIINKNGEILGKHQGLAFYTNGQRKGIGLADSRPYFVIDKDFSKNQLIAGHLEELGKTSFTVSDFNWICGEVPDTSFATQIKIRYRSKFASGKINPLNNGKVVVELDEKLADITPGQFAVFYSGDVALGGGMIDKNNL